MGTFGSKKPTYNKDQYGNKYIPRLSGVETTMAWLDSLVTRHDWHINYSGDPVIRGSGFNWKRFYSEEISEDVVPKIAPPFNLEGYPMYVSGFWQQFKPIAKFVGRRIGADWDNRPYNNISSNIDWSGNRYNTDSPPNEIIGGQQLDVILDMFTYGQIPKYFYETFISNNPIGTQIDIPFNAAYVKSINVQKSGGVDYVAPQGPLFSLDYFNDGVTRNVLTAYTDIHTIPFVPDEWIEKSLIGSGDIQDVFARTETVFPLTSPHRRPMIEVVPEARILHNNVEDPVFSFNHYYTAILASSLQIATTDGSLTYLFAANSRDVSSIYQFNKFRTFGAAPTLETYDFENFNGIKSSSNYPIHVINGCLNGWRGPNAIVGLSDNANLTLRQRFQYRNVAFGDHTVNYFFANSGAEDEIVYRYNSKDYFNLFNFGGVTTAINSGLYKKNYGKDYNGLVNALGQYPTVEMTNSGTIGSFQQIINKKDTSNRFLDIYDRIEYSSIPVMDSGVRTLQEQTIYFVVESTTNGVLTYKHLGHAWTFGRLAEVFKHPLVDHPTVGFLSNPIYGYDFGVETAGWSGVAGYYTYPNSGVYLNGIYHSSIQQPDNSWGVEVNLGPLLTRKNLFVAGYFQDQFCFFSGIKNPSFTVGQEFGSNLFKVEVDPAIDMFGSSIFPAYQL